MRYLFIWRLTSDKTANERSKQNSKPRRTCSYCFAAYLERGISCGPEAPSRGRFFESPRRSRKGIADGQAPDNITMDTEQDERLKFLAAQNATAIRASAALNKPLSSVRVGARKLGLMLPGARELKARTKALAEAAYLTDRR